MTTTVESMLAKGVLYNQRFGAVVKILCWKRGWIMTNREKYDDIFMTCFNIDKSKLNGDLIYNCIPEWDSIGHMGMIAGLEEAFDIMMDTEDIIDFSSYTKGVEILKKYDIQV